MGDEQYCLKWNSYKSSVTSAFKKLRENQEFVDVTLSSDGKSCQAHRVVLSASSPYFRDLLGGLQSWQHPVLLLRDVPYSDLVAVLEFIYAGQVNITQSQLQSFLKTAQYLQISGLVEEEVLEGATNGASHAKEIVKQTVKRKLNSEDHGKKFLKKDGDSKDEAGVVLALKAEPIEIGPTEFSCSFPTSGSSQQESVVGRGSGAVSEGGDESGQGGSPSDGSVICLVCRATLSNCNALYYHMNYVHSGGVGVVEPLDMLRKITPSDPLVSVKQEHIE